MSSTPDNTHRRLRWGIKQLTRKDRQVPGGHGLSHFLCVICPRGKSSAENLQNISSLHRNKGEHVVLFGLNIWEGWRKGGTLQRRSRQINPIGLGVHLWPFLIYLIKLNQTKSKPCPLDSIPYCLAERPGAAVDTSRVDQSC